MAITIIEAPNQNQSAYNPIKWKLSSDNVNKEGFRYIVEIIDAGTSNRLAELDIIPDPTDGGNCNLDITRLVRNKVDKFLDINSLVLNNAPGTNYRYDIRFGESYTGDWVFEDYINDTGDIALTTDSAYGPSFSNATHGYSQGDQIYIEMSVVHNDNRDFINGYWTVVRVVNDKTIVINLGFSVVGSGPASSGTVRYADRRKVRNLNLTNQTNRLVINKAMGFKEFISTGGSMASYLIDGTTEKRLLSNIPDNYSIGEHQYLFINSFENANDLGKRIIFEASDGSSFYKLNSGGPSFYVKSNSVGPGNLGTLNVISGSLPLIKPEVIWYDVYLGDASNVRISEKKRIWIDKRCRISEEQILFMDRSGAFSSFGFQLKKRRSITTEKEMYRVRTNDVSLADEGKRVYVSEYVANITLNTNFMSGDMNLYFEELLTSPYTFINYEGDWYSCKIDAGSFNTETSRNKRLMRRSVNILFDINSPVNI